MRAKHYSIAAVLIKLAGEVKRLGSADAVARAAEVSPQFVNDVLHHRRKPTGDLLYWLGYERQTVYRKRNEVAAEWDGLMERVKKIARRNWRTPAPAPRAAGEEERG